ncbi:hypothetical protein [Streptomyces tsukubensis]|uniref:hypothetical protein n=1 Tax=Streptomyces tsukubensis TaxID=83656 RepID=UPI0011803FC9|nr:hypothetical protein [Streptomyces tsukubensis]QFR95834.1 hypothetical protein GBW32_25870 [Streptomyces tsukubensis]
MDSRRFPMAESWEPPLKYGIATARVDRKPLAVSSVRHSPSGRRLPPFISVTVRFNSRAGPGSSPRARTVPQRSPGRPA